MSCIVLVVNIINFFLSFPDNDYLMQAEFWQFFLDTSE